MGMKNDLNSETISDLVNYVGAQDGAAYFALGESTRGDRSTRLYLYDSGSSVTADGDNILTATGMGVGRFLKVKMEGDIPTGTIKPYAGSSAPDDYLFCDGTTVSRSTYANLFTIIGTTYGSGDGSTTYNLPDTRQRFILGRAFSGTGSVLGAIGGSIDHVHSVNPPSTTSSSNGDHNHTGVTGSPSTTVAATALGGSAASPTHTHNISTDGAHTHTTDVAAFNSAIENPPYLSLNYIIKI